MNTITPITAILALIPPKARAIVECVLSLITLASMIVAVLPASASKYWPVRVLRIVGALVHSDEPGTIKIPMTGIVLGVTVKGPPPPPAPPKPPPAPVLMALLAIALVSCGPSPTQTQSDLDNVLAIAATRGEAAWLGVYRAEGRAAADAAGSDTDARLAAVHVVRDRWLHVREAYEALAHAQGVDATLVEACEADPTHCDASALGGAALIGAVLAYRCAVRAVGHPELDFAPGVPACAEVH
jgi:hypothetical protein